MTDIIWTDIDKTTVIPFDWIDQTPGGSNLGRAEFVVCVNFKRGRISEYWVDAVQTRLKQRWHFTGGRSDFTVSAYQRLATPKVWMVSWCKEHKCTSFRVYAPEEARYLRLDPNGLSFWKT